MDAVFHENGAPNWLSEEECSCSVTDSCLDLRGDLIRVIAAIRAAKLGNSL